MARRKLAAMTETPTQLRLWPVIAGFLAFMLLPALLVLAGAA